MKIKKGDNVIVLTGKDKGKKGKVSRAFPALDKVLVEGINKFKKHQRPKKIKEKENKAFELLKSKFGYKNKMAAPHLTKVVINSGTGSALQKDKNRNDLVMDRLAKITGQKG